MENTNVNICKESGIDVDARDIEGCHQLLLARNSRGHDKRLIVKFVNGKFSEAMLKDKKQISGKKFGYLHVTNKVFVSVLLCPCYRYIWGKCKDMKRQEKVHHVFCLGSIVCINLLENGSPVKLHHISNFLTFLQTRILKINFHKNSICSVYIIKSLSFFCCVKIFIILLQKLIVTSVPPTSLLFISLLLRTDFTDLIYWV